MDLTGLVPVWVGKVSPRLGGAKVSFVALDVTERRWRQFVPVSVFPFDADWLRAPLFIKLDERGRICELIFGTPTVGLVRSGIAESDGAYPA